MLSNFYPRIEPIIVPRNIGAEFIGTYVSDRAAAILSDLGVGRFNPKTVAIRTTDDERRFYLIFEGYRPAIPNELRQQMLSEKEEMDRAAESKVSGPMRGDGVLATRSKGRPGKDDPTTK